MPIYEYRCQACGNEFEYQQRISDDPKTECEQCGGALEKLISRSAFHLKGGGWYKDLYSSPKPGADKSGDAKSGEAKSGGAKSGDAKPGDAKPADKGGSETKSSGAAASSSGSSSGSGD